MRRCNLFKKLRDLIKNDLIKMPFTGFCLYSGGVFNNASHFINLFEFFLEASIGVKYLQVDVVEMNLT